MMPAISADQPTNRYDGVDSPALRRARIDRDYDNSAVFSDVPSWREKWRLRSEAMSAGHIDRLNLAYGSEAMQKLDLFPVGSPAAPTALFIHGGFWTRNSKETFRFLTRGIHAAGCNAVFLGYTLAPNARMDQMVGEVRSGGLWLFGKLRELGLAQRPLVVIGWSAGAHLAALMMDNPHIAAGMGISGIYDLRPMREASVNDALQLSQDEVLRHSPSLNPIQFAGRFIVTYGGRELPAFRTQSEEFCAAATAIERFVLPEHTHHSILEELYRSDGELVKELARLTA